MGLCGSAEASDDHNTQQSKPKDNSNNNNNENANNDNSNDNNKAKPNAVQLQSSEATRADAGGAGASKDPSTTTKTSLNGVNGDSSARSSSSSVASVDDDEFRDTVKLVLLLVLERMIRALDYERDSLVPLSKQVFNDENVIVLANGAAIEAFLRQHYQIDETTARKNQNSNQDEMMRFTDLIMAAQLAGYRTPLPSVASVASSVVNLARAIRDSLSSASSSSLSSDVKLHLSFFSRALEFATKGDIVKDPQTLFRNIDEVTRE